MNPLARIVCSALFLAFMANSRGAEFKVGVASVDVTPDYPIRLSGYAVRKGESEGWYEAVIANLNVIDGDIRSRRNAFVHSPWFVPKGKLVRHKKSTKIAKSQAFQPPVLTTLEITPVKIAEARKLKDDMLKALRSAVHQLAFAMDFGWHTSQKTSFEESRRLQSSRERPKGKPASPRRQRVAG